MITIICSHLYNCIYLIAVTQSPLCCHYISSQLHCHHHHTIVVAFTFTSSYSSLHWPHLNNHHHFPHLYNHSRAITLCDHPCVISTTQSPLHHHYIFPFCYHHHPIAHILLTTYSPFCMSLYTHIHLCSIPFPVATPITPQPSHPCHNVVHHPSHYLTFTPSSCLHNSGPAAVLSLYSCHRLDLHGCIINHWCYATLLFIHIQSPLLHCQTLHHCHH